MSQPLPRYLPPNEDWNQKLARILIETGEPAPDQPTSRTVTRADHTDKARLRGIPVAGGACGTSPGTDPLHEAERLAPSELTR